MSYQATAWALYQDTKNPTLKALLQTLCHHADSETWECYPSMDTIARETCISKRTVQRRLQELVELGFIEIISQRGEFGRQGNNLYRITGGQSVTLEPPGGQVELPGGQNQQSRVPLVSTNKEIGGIGENNTRAKKSKAEEPYSADFETLWQQYPRTKNTSKKKAWDHYRMLSDENQERVRRAVPAFAAAMRAEGRPEDKIKHFQFFLSERIWETVAASPAAAPPGSALAKPFWEIATRKQWCDALIVWSTNWNWNKSWGPEPQNPMRPLPGQPAHHVPHDILDRFDLKHRAHLYSEAELAVIRERVEAASKHAVDKDRAA